MKLFSVGRKYIAISTSIVLASSGVLLVGASTSNAAADCGPNRELNFVSVGDPFEYALKEVLPQFTAETGIKVKLTGLDNQTLQTRLAAAFVTGKSDLDVVTVDNIWIGQYYDNKWILSLNDMIKKDPTVNIKDFIPQVLYSISEWRGQLVGLPIAPYAQGVMYRDDIYKKFNLKPAKTWNQYLKNAKAVNGKTFKGKKIYGNVIVGKQPVPIVHMYTGLQAGQGSRWFKSFPEAPWDFTPNMASKENIRAAKIYKALYDVSPKESITYDWFGAGMRFADGDIAQMYWWTPYFYLVNAKGYMSGKPSPVVGKFKITPMPQEPGKGVHVSTGGWQVSIPSTADCPELSWKLVNWIASAKTQKAMGLVSKYGAQFSDFGRTSLYSDPELLKLYPYLPAQLKMMKSGDGKVSRPGMPLYPALEGIYGLQLNKILTGAPIKSTLQDTNALFTNILNGNLYLPYKGVSYDDTFANTQKLIDSLD